MTLPLVVLALSPELASELQFEDELVRLAPHAQLQRWPGPGNPDSAFVAAALERADAIVTGWGTPRLTALEAWQPDNARLRLVAHSAGTVKTLVPVEAIERGLMVTHANESLAEAVAEFTIGALIMGRRQAFYAAEGLRKGEVRDRASVRHEVRGSTVGVIGASAIGRRVVELLGPLGARVLLYDPYCTTEQAAALGATLVSLPALLAQSDTVTLHAPVTAETLGMLGAAEFAAMRDGALFINTARGRLIDADALLRELQRGRISALLDVTDPTEPLPADSPFLALENCVVLPHIAAATAQARQRQGRMMVDELLRFLTGQALHYQVTRARWDTMA